MHYWKFCPFLQIVPLIMLWTLAKCLLSLQLSEKAFGHILQPYGFSPKNNTVFQSIFNNITHYVLILINVFQLTCVHHFVCFQSLGLCK